MKDPNKKPLFFETEKLICTLMEGKYLYLHIYEGMDVEIEDIIEMVSVLKKNIKKGDYPLLVDFGYGSSISSEARAYAANRAKRIASADAFVIKSFAQRLIMNFYMKFNKPTLPSAVFKSKEDALEWLKQFIKN